MKKHLVSVVIPCLNGSPTIARLVDSLRQQELPPDVGLEIVVVDNGSTDGTGEILKKLPVTAVLESKKGPAAARNSGVRASHGDIAVFLDADTRACDAFLIAEHLKTLERFPDVGIAGGSITPDPEQKSWLAFAENATGLFNWHGRLPARYVSFQPMGNMAFRRSLYEEIGPLDETLLCLEDFEWNMRAKRAGHKVFFDPQAGVFIRGRESLPTILKKFYRWGLNVFEVYAPGRRDQVWLFPEHGWLFGANVPLRILNETWVTVKRWFPVCPVKCVLMIPLFLLYRTAWAAGIGVGARRSARARTTADLQNRETVDEKNR